MNLLAHARTPAPCEIPRKYLWGSIWCLAPLMNHSRLSPTSRPCLTELPWSSLLSSKCPALFRVSKLVVHLAMLDPLIPQSDNLLQIRLISPLGQSGLCHRLFGLLRVTDFIETACSFTHDSNFSQEDSVHCQGE